MDLCCPSIEDDSPKDPWKLTRKLSHENWPESYLMKTDQKVILCAKIVLNCRHVWSNSQTNKPVCNKQTNIKSYKTLKQVKTIFLVWQQWPNNSIVSQVVSDSSRYELLSSIAKTFLVSPFGWQVFLWDDNPAKSEGWLSPPLGPRCAQILPISSPDTFTWYPWYHSCF